MKTTDVAFFRCPMCPNKALADKICHAKRMECEFVVCFIDKNGWKYKVMPDAYGTHFKARRQPPRSHGERDWRAVPELGWKTEYDDAQRELNRFAARRRMEVWSG